MSVLRRLVPWASFFRRFAADPTLAERWRQGRDPSTAHLSSLCSGKCFAQDDTARQIDGYQTLASLAGRTNASVPTHSDQISRITGMISGRFWDCLLM